MVRRSFLCMPQRLLETGQEQAHVLSTHTPVASYILSEGMLVVETMACARVVALDGLTRHGFP